MTLELHYSFDENTFRHKINGHVMVLHCHHYMSLTTKLAMEYSDLDGPRILRESAEDSIAPVLRSYVSDHHITTHEQILAIGCEYYAAMGLGKMSAYPVGLDWEVKLTRSHVDDGWIQKWGKYHHAINHFSCGFIAAMFCVAFSRAPRSYLVTEQSSIVTGDPVSVFAVRPA